MKYAAIARKTYQITLRAACIVLAMCAAVAHSAPAVPQTPITIELEKSAVSLGEPVLATIKMENRSSESMDLDLGGDGQDNLLISVETADGARRQVARAHHKGSAVFFGKAHVERGQVYSETIVLSEWFRFERVGRYKIEVGVKSPVKADNQVMAVGNVSLFLDVTPRDPRQLTASCEDLVSRIQANGSAQDALAAARALSLVDDPIVVSLWKRVLSNRAFSETAVSNLARIGNKDAVDALATALHSADEQTRSLVETALRSIASQTSDLSVRSDAQDALSR